MKTNYGFFLGRNIPAAFNELYPWKIRADQVSFAADPLNVSTSFLSVVEKFDKYRGPLDDANAFFFGNGYGVRHHSQAATSKIC